MRLTSAQKQIYNMELFAGESIGVICGTVLFDKIYDIDKMKHAINEVYRINDALRTRISIESGEPNQYVTEYTEREIKVLSFDSKEDVHKYANRMAQTPFDFSGNLCELDILMSDNFCGVIYRLHHIISDGWTLALLASQFYKILNGESVEAFQYSDYVAEEEKYLQSKRAVKDKAYYIERYNRIDEPVYLFDTPPKIGKSARKSYIIGKSKTSEITEYIKKENASSYTFFLTLINTYFSRIKDNTDKFFIGTTVLNRTTHSQLNTAGMFVNTVPYLSELDTEKSFSYNLKNTEESIFGLFRHQKYNYIDILSQVSEDRLFDVIFSYQNNTIYGDDFLSTWYHCGMQNESLQIHIDDRDSEGIFRIHYDYQTEKFSEKDIDTLHQHICNLLSDAIRNDTKKLYELTVLSADEQKKLLVEFNDTAVDYPRDKCVHQLFEEQVEKTPDKAAVIFDGIKITYLELQTMINDYCIKFTSLGICADDVVGIHINRSHRLIAFQLAVLKMGAVFLPVDKRYPRDRIEYMCSDCNVKLLVSDELTENVNNTTVISLDDFEKIEVNGTVKEVYNHSVCYIIYTSGSTGTPKGCMLTDKGLVNFCMNNNTLQTLNRITNPAFACVNSVSFDYFIAESLLPLLNGFTTVILDDTQSTIQDHFLSIVEENKINVVMTTPTRLKIYYDNKNDCSALKQLKCICTSGEPLTPELLAQLYNKSPNAQIYNPLGPSECTVWDVGGELDGINGLDIHIGKPIANTQIYIVDKYMNPTPIGVTGELCIAGDCVGAGYLNRPELTSEKFIDNPFGKGTLYKTGDLAYWREDGNIIYVGRNDFQVKIRGLRIELGEIENAILSIDGISQAVVIVRKDETGRQLICAFYTGAKTDAEEIRNILGKRLPKYMVPHIFTHIDEMPLTSSGKVNRKALPEVNLESIETGAEYVAPETEAEIALIDVIQNILGCDTVSVIDNFFELGGDSISAIHIVAELQSNNYEIPVSAIMQSDTIADIAAQMKPTQLKNAYKQDEVSGHVEFSPILRTYLNENPSNPETFAHSCIMSADCTETELRLALDAIVLHHDVLRSVVFGNELVIRKSADAPLYNFKVEPRFSEEKNIQNATDYLKKEKISFDLKNGPLVDIVFCPTNEGNVFRLSIHHFVVDIVSWNILLEDFHTALEQIKKNNEIQLPAKTASFIDWLEALKNHKNKTMSDEEFSYWTDINNKIDKISPLFSKDSSELLEETYTLTLDKTTTARLLYESNNAFQTHTNELLLTALGLAAQNIADKSVGILAESHGRAELPTPISIGRTVGWFTSLYPVIFEKTSDISDAIIKTKEAMRHVPYNGIGYLMLFENLCDNISIIFNYFNGNQKEENSNDNLIDFCSDGAVFPGKLTVDCVIVNGALQAEFKLFAHTTAKGLTEQLAQSFKHQLERLIDKCTGSEQHIKTISDFSDTSLLQSELDDIEALFGEEFDDE